MKNDGSSTYWLSPWLHPQYQCLSEVGIGEGLAPRRYSRVFRALNRATQRIVCIKQSRVTGLSLEEQWFGRSFFQREAALLRDLAHPSLVHLLDTFQERGREHLVLEWIEGASLEEYLLQHPLPSLRSTCAWGIQICDVLTYLHNQQRPIVHRDIKPANVMIREDDGSIIVVDLSIARRLSLSPLRTDPSGSPKGDTSPLGTTGYAAPEQREGKTTTSSDLYSLGVFLHQALSGENPAKKPKEHLNDFADLDPAVPPALETLITSLTRASALQRPTNARTVRNVLLDIERGLPTAEHTPPRILCSV